jgi:hypothetical protein
MYDLIIGFGCSFMEGGGLDNPEIHKRINKLNKVAELQDAITFKHKNNFIAYLGEIYKCEYINLAESRCPNDLIFENIYNYFNDKKIDKKILMIGQISLFSRLYVYYEKTKQYLKLNSLDFNLPPFNGEDAYKELYQYYENYLSYIYNENLVYNKIIRDITTYTNWLESIGIDCIMIKNLEQYPIVREEIGWTPEKLIRFENRIVEHWEAGKIRGPIHLSNGNEEQLIEIFKRVSENDWVFSTWRSHYHWLLKGISSDYAESLILDGKSITLCDINEKFYSSAIVGGVGLVNHYMIRISMKT